MKHFVTLALISALLYFGYVQYGNPFAENTTSIERLAGQVIGVLDGDTVKLRVGTETMLVHLIGIDAPEHGQRYGGHAGNYLADLVNMQIVVVEVRNVDRRGEPLGELYLNNMSVNKLMLTDGYAWAKRGIAENASWVGLEKLARDKRFGLWREAGATSPWDYREMIRQDS
jgi:endonuclease YncB( thermonuclease family)